MTFRKTFGALFVSATIGLSSCSKKHDIDLTSSDKIFTDGIELKVGDEARIPEWEWINALNHERHCGVKTGGTLKIVGFTEDKKILVKYGAPGRTGRGTSAPSGTKYLVEPERFVGLTGRYNEKVRKVSELKRELEKILHGESDLKEVGVGGLVLKVGDKARIPEGGRVDVMNLDSVTQHYVNGSKELVFSDDGVYETCVVKTGGIIEVLGFISDKRALVEYDAPGKPLGTEAPDGVQYLIEPEKFIALK